MHKGKIEEYMLKGWLIGLFMGPDSTSALIYLRGWDIISSSHREVIDWLIFIDKAG